MSGAAVSFADLLARYGVGHPDGLYDDRRYGCRVSFEEGVILCLHDRDDLSAPWFNPEWRLPWGSYPDVVRTFEVEADLG